MPVIGPIWPCDPGHFREGREISGTCLQCVWQRLTRSVETQMVFQLDLWLLLGGIAHHKHWPQNMCYTHSWPQQYPTYTVFVTAILSTCIVFFQSPVALESILVQLVHLLYITNLSYFCENSDPTVKRLCQIYVTIPYFRGMWARWKGCVLQNCIWTACS